MLTSLYQFIKTTVTILLVSFFLGGGGGGVVLISRILLFEGAFFIQGRILESGRSLDYLR